MILTLKLSYSWLYFIFFFRSDGPVEERVITDSGTMENSTSMSGTVNKFAC